MSPFGKKDNKTKKAKETRGATPRRRSRPRRPVEPQSPRWHLGAESARGRLDHAGACAAHLRGEALIEKPGGRRRPPSPVTEPPVDRTPEPPRPVDPAEAIRALADGRHQQPHDLLGHHLEPGGLRMRVYRPLRRGGARCASRTASALELAHEADGVWGGAARRARPRPWTTACS